MTKHVPKRRKLRFKDRLQHCTLTTSETRKISLCKCGNLFKISNGFEGLKYKQRNQKSNGDRRHVTHSATRCVPRFIPIVRLSRFMQLYRGNTASFGARRRHLKMTDFSRDIVLSLAPHAGGSGTDGCPSRAVVVLRNTFDKSTEQRVCGSLDTRTSVGVYRAAMQLRATPLTYIIIMFGTVHLICADTLGPDVFTARHFGNRGLSALMTAIQVRKLYWCLLACGCRKFAS